MIYYHFLVTEAPPWNSVCHFTGSFHPPTLSCIQVLHGTNPRCVSDQIAFSSWNIQFPCKKLVRLVSSKRCLLIQAIIQKHTEPQQQDPSQCFTHKWQWKSSCSVPHSLELPLPPLCPRGLEDDGVTLLHWLKYVSCHDTSASCGTLWQSYLSYCKHIGINKTQQGRLLAEAPRLRPCLRPCWVLLIPICLHLRNWIDR